MYIPTSDPPTERDRYEMICEQVIGPLDLDAVMEQARRKGASPQFILFYMLCEVQSRLSWWRHDGLLEPEDHALQQAMKYVTGLSFGRLGEPLKEYLGRCKLELVADRKMRRTK